MDVPPAPAGEHNRVTITAGPAGLSAETADDVITIEPAQLAAWRAASTFLTISIERAGPYGLSVPAMLTLVL